VNVSTAGNSVSEMASRPFFRVDADYETPASGPFQEVLDTMGILS